MIVVRDIIPGDCESVCEWHIGVCTERATMVIVDTDDISDSYDGFHLAHLCKYHAMRYPLDG